MVRTAYCNVEIAPTELLVTKSTDLVKMSVVLTFYRLFAKVFLDDLIKLKLVLIIMKKLFNLYFCSRPFISNNICLNK